MILYCAELDQILFFCGSENIGGETHIKIMVSEDRQEFFDHTAYVENHEWVYIGIF